MSSASIRTSMRTSASPAADAAATPRPRGAGPGSVSRIRRWSVQSPPFSTSVGMPGSGMIAAERPPPPANSNAVT